MNSRIYKILQGVRGAAAVDLDQLIDIIFRFAQLCENLTPTVAEIDINPLHVSAHDILALDALIIRASAIQR